MEKGGDKTVMTERICSVGGCSIPVGKEHTTRKRCPKHYIKLRRCHHGKVANVCKNIECILDPENKSWMCIHKGKARRKNDCPICNKGGRCPHSGIIARFCACCEGTQICPHGRQKAICKEPECIRNSGGICECGKLRYLCKKCGGGAYCACGVLKRSCKKCDPPGHLMSVVRERVYNALKRDKQHRSIDYLGCTIDFYKRYMEGKFQEGMCWANHGEWHIDHIIPLRYQNPTVEQVAKRLHYTNTQPLWARDNLFKGNRFISKKY